MASGLIELEELKFGMKADSSCFVVVVVIGGGGGFSIFLAGWLDWWMLEDEQLGGLSMSGDYSVVTYETCDSH